MSTKKTSASTKKANQVDTSKKTNSITEEVKQEVCKIKKEIVTTPEGNKVEVISEVKKNPLHYQIAKVCYEVGRVFLNKEKTIEEPIEELTWNDLKQHIKDDITEQVKNSLESTDVDTILNTLLGISEDESEDESKERKMLHTLYKTIINSYRK